MTIVAFFAGAFFGMLAVALARAAGEPAPRPKVEGIDGRFEDSEAGERAA